jgi:GT2 family glycosyltransferase
VLSIEFHQNIDESIGCEYQLIVIDNSKNKYSIFEAYNLGMEKSLGDFLCFIHDDILFSTKNWGVVLTSIFDANAKIGLIGVAGAKVKTKMPSTWWDNYEGQNVINIIQHHQGKEKEVHNYGFDKEQNVEVVVIDGVFMAIRKDDRIAFDTKLKGFHSYDLNLSFEVVKLGYSIVVTNEIVIEHFSSGVINESWVKSSYELHKKYKSKLPIFTDGNIVSKKHEIINAHRFINKCLQFKLKRIAILVWFKLFLLYPFSIENVRIFKKILKN